MMPKPQQQVAVIGSGVVGLATAWHFAKSGIKVTVFGKQDAPNMASWAAIGHVGLKGGVVETGKEHLSKPAYVLKSKGLQGYEAWLTELECESGLSIDWKKGFREYYDSPESREAIFNRVLKNRIKYQKSWGNVKEVKTAKESSGYFLYEQDIWVSPESLLPCLKTSFLQKGGKLVETLVKTFKIGINKKIQLFNSSIDNLGSYDGVVVASGEFANSCLAQLRITGTNIKFTEGWKASVKSDASTFERFKDKDQITSPKTRLLFSQPAGASSPLLEIRKVRPLLWRSESVETSFSKDPGVKPARHGLRYETKDQAPIVGPISGQTDPFLALNICHHKSGFVTAPPAAEMLLRSFLGRPVYAWERALSPERFEPSGAPVLKS